MNDRTKDYVFLSYSHQHNIKDLVKAFDEHGYNIVFDESMSYEEQWNLSVRRYIKSERCRGVVLLISDKSLTSKPFLNEIENTNMFRKKMFCIMNDNMKFAELCNVIENIFNVGFSFGLNCIDELIKFNPNNEHLKQERIWFEEVLTKFKEIFFDRKFGYCNISYIAIAGVKE